MTEIPHSRLFLQDAPPLLPTLTSSKYHIKWERLTDLPATVFEISVAVQGVKIYVSGTTKPEKPEYHVFVYETETNRWDELPTPDHYNAIPHITGGKLTLIGGRLVNGKITNRVSTFNQAKQSWVSYYPDLHSSRSRPGVATHMEYVIVAGGVRGDDVLDDIEILDWVEKSQWKTVSVQLPVPMYNLLLTVSNEHLCVAGHHSADERSANHVFEFPVEEITSSTEQQQSIPTGWVELCQETHQYSTLVTGLPSLVVAGGEGKADIMMYNRSTQKWNRIDSLSFTRSKAAVTAIGNTAIVVAGGQTSTESNILTVVELGQVEEI